MKMLFFGTKTYDREFFDKGLKEERYKDIDIHYIEPNLTPETAELAHGYDAVCAFVNMDLGKETVDILHEMGVKLILMRCAGYNNVDVEEAKKHGMTVMRVPSYSPEAVAEHAMALAAASMCISGRAILWQIKKKLRWKSWKIIPVFLLTREPTTRFILQKKY